MRKRDGWILLKCLNGYAKPLNALNVLAIDRKAPLFEKGNRGFSLLGKGWRWAQVRRFLRNHGDICGS